MKQDIFIDPWIDRNFYYKYLPILPLLHEKIFIYYPSDRWAKDTMNSNQYAIWLENFKYWIQKNVFIPVVQANYPFNESDISEYRWKNDQPTKEFLEILRQQRKTLEKKRRKSNVVDHHKSK